MVWIILWIFSSISDSICTVFRKKAVNDTKIPWYYVALSWEFYSILICLTLLIIWAADYHIFLQYHLYIFVGISAAANVLKTPLDNKVYREEKLSAIVPYENLSDLLIIISSFFFFRDTSITSFLIAILAVGVVVIGTIDFKWFVMPRNFIPIIMVKLLLTVQMLFMWFALKQVGTMWDFYVLYNVIIVWVTLLVAFVSKKSKKKLMFNKRNFFLFMFIAAIAWEWTEIMKNFIIKDFWLVITTLLCFLYIWVTLILSYIMFKDKPAKKDIIMTILVTILVCIWYYLK